MKLVVTVQEAVKRIFLVYKSLKAPNSLSIDACDQALLILTKIQDQKLVTLD